MEGVGKGFVGKGIIRKLLSLFVYSRGRREICVFCAHGDSALFPWETFYYPGGGEDVSL